MLALSSEEKILLYAANLNLESEKILMLNQLLTDVINWSSFIERIIRNGVGPLFYSKLSKLENCSLIPLQDYGILKQSYFHTLSRGMLMYTVFDKTVKLLHQAGIEVIVLKGAHLAESLYKDIALRQFSDIDLLISEEDGEKSVSVLKNHSYYQSGEEISHLIIKESGLIHYPAMIFNHVSVELHIRLVSPNEKFQIDTNTLFKHSEIKMINGLKVRVLEMYDLLIYICLHIDKHFKAGHVQFTGYYDIVNLLNLYKEQIEPQLLINRCKEYKCELAVFKQLLLVSKYYQISIPKADSSSFSWCLTKKDEQLFVDYLNGYQAQSYGVISHLKNIVNISGFSAKIRYFRLVVFPSKKFIENRYNKHTQTSNWHLYFMRYLHAFKGLYQIIFKNRNLK